MAKYAVTTNDGRKITVEASNASAAADIAKSWVAKNPKLSTAISGGISAFGEGAFPFYNELAAGLSTPIDVIGDAFSGKKVNPAQSYKDLLGRLEGNQAAFAAANPTASALTTGIGMAAPVAATMGAGLISGLAKAAAPMATQVAPGLLARAGQGAAIGGAYGGAYGAGQPGSIEDRFRAASGGATSGMAAGAALPVAADTLAGVGRGAARIANRVSGGRLLDADAEGLKRLREAMIKDGFTSEKIKAVAAEWRKSGLSPNLLDIVGDGGGGQYTKRFVRMAASTGGPAANVAQEYALATREGLGEKVQAAAAPLSPRRIGTEAAIEKTTAARKRLADMIFKFVGERGVVLTPEMQRVLSTDVGQQAVKDAAKLADQRALRTGLPKDRIAAAELYKLSRGAEETTVSAVDRVRRLISDAETAGLKDAARSVAGEATAARKQFVAGAKEQVPEYAKGLEVLSGAHGREKAYEIGSKILTMPVDDFAAATAKMSNSDKRAAALAAKNAIQGLAGNSPSGAYSVEGRMAYAPDLQKRLAMLSPKADAVRTASRRAAEQARTAQFIAPNTGSQTFSRELDAAWGFDIPTSKVGIIRGILGKVRAGVSLTEAEREAIVRLATVGDKRVPGVFVGSENVTGPETAGILSLLSTRPPAIVGATIGQQQGQ